MNCTWKQKVTTGGHAHSSNIVPKKISMWFDSYWKHEWLFFSDICNYCRLWTLNHTESPVVFTMNAFW